jgi:transcription termination/antitermination protein NusA
MTKEILDAVTVLEREKGIDGEVLLTALEDALLAAYKKTPGAARHAKVELDRDTGDIRVLALTLPDEVLLSHPGVTIPDPVEPVEGEELAEGEEPVEPEPIIDWAQFEGDEIAITDVTPDNFGRIAAQTAKQVILQRIREAER